MTLPLASPLVSCMCMMQSGTLAGGTTLAGVANSATSRAVVAAARCVCSHHLSTITMLIIITMAATIRDLQPPSINLFAVSSPLTSCGFVRSRCPCMLVHCCSRSSLLVPFNLILSPDSLSGRVTYTLRLTATDGSQGEHEHLR